MKAKKKKLLRVRKKSAKKPKKILVKKKKSSPVVRTTGLTPFPAQTFFKAKIKVIGIGGGGGSIVSEIGRSLNKATFVVADTDMRAFKKRAGIRNFLFGQKLTHGLGTGVNPELGRQAAEEAKEKITHLFDDQDIIIFIASLGGGLGSGATQVFAEATKDFNGITLGIFTLPFKFEGVNKYKIALKSLKELRKVLNVSVTIPNERIFKIIDQNTAITDAFSIVNKSLIESLESLIDLIYSPGIINIDFADLRAILSGKGNLAFLNTAEASGKNRAADVGEKILHNPLYQNNNFIADKILFNIEGGGNLGMFEVDQISKKISEHHPKAKIIFGISKNSALKNKIKTTLLMTGPSSAKEAAPIPLPEIVKEKPRPKKVAKKIKKIKKRKRLTPAPKFPLPDALPVLDNTLEDELVTVGTMKLDITEAAVKPNPSTSLRARKAIRRNALEVKKAEEVEEKKQSLQEKEWEIPAFLRIKK